MYIFPVQMDLRIDWSEMDLFGHVNNVAYFKYIQACRVRYWEVAGLDHLFKEEQIGPVLLSTSCQFMKPLHYPGSIKVGARVEFIKNTSFGIHQRIWDESGDIAAEAHDVIVTFNYHTQEKVPVPEGFRKSVAEMEGRSM